MSRAGSSGTALLCAALAVAAALSTGCASRTPPRTDALVTSQQAAHWSGRLSLRVEDQPTQSFSAGFELTGSASEGSLRLSSPFGNTLAAMRWSAAGARLQASGQTLEYESLQAMVTSASGAELPVATLFDWLAGKDTGHDGWQVDLAQFGQGRITARRQQPATEIRIVLD